ncbi:MAG: DUF951 domain-containing protein [Clostridia bacterium]|nr:DUF951 domain-containing protein [Clostridia bacterium]
MVEEIRLGDRVQTRKKHPCGSDEWTVIRTGADIKIRCHGCGRIVMLDRQDFLRRRKRLISQGPEMIQTQSEGDTVK